MLMAAVLFVTPNLFGQDSGSVTTADTSSMAMAKDTSAIALKKDESLIDSVANNRALLYVIAAIVFVLIIGLTLLSSIRGAKREKNNIGYRKPGGHHHHHHKHHHHH